MSGNVDDMRMGITIGDGDGYRVFKTSEVLPVCDAIAEANAFLAEKYGNRVKIGLLTGHKRRNQR